MGADLCAPQPKDCEANNCAYGSFLQHSPVCRHRWQARSAPYCDGDPGHESRHHWTARSGLHPREKKLHQLDYFAHITGMKAVAGPTIRRADIEFGNALLTRREIIHVRFHDVTVVRRQPRGVIDAEIVCDGKIIRVLVTHFGLALNERRRQAQALLKILRQPKASYALTLVIGDINEWRPRGFALYSLNSHLGKAPSLRTFPSFFPVFALDRIWVKPRGHWCKSK